MDNGLPYPQKHGLVLDSLSTLAVTGGYPRSEDIKLRNSKNKFTPTHLRALSLQQERETVHPAPKQNDLGTGI